MVENVFVAVTIYSIKIESNANRYNLFSNVLFRWYYTLRYTINEFSQMELWHLKRIALLNNTYASLTCLPPQVVIMIFHTSDRYLDMLPVLCRLLYIIG